MSIKGTETEKNLLKSFAGESQARNRYNMFAKIARKEGYEQIAAYFEETASNEQSHAKQFFRYLEGGNVEVTATYPAGKEATTAENLKASAMGENEEYTVLYPMFADIAEKEGFKDIATTFRLVAKVEAHHEQRFLQLLANLEKGTQFKKDKPVEWKCWICGHIHTGDKAPEKCPLCKHPKAYFAVKETNY